MYMYRIRIVSVSVPPQPPPPLPTTTPTTYNQPNASYYRNQACLPGSIEPRAHFALATIFFILSIPLACTSFGLIHFELWICTSIEAQNQSHFLADDVLLSNFYGLSFDQSFLICLNFFLLLYLDIVPIVNFMCH